MKGVADITDNDWCTIVSQQPEIGEMADISPVFQAEDILWVRVETTTLNLEPTSAFSHYLSCFEP
jgi:hypothetical protein